MFDQAQGLRFLKQQRNSTPPTPSEALEKTVRVSDLLEKPAADARAVEETAVDHRYAVADAALLKTARLGYEEETRREPRPRNVARVIAVTSGKGGVGKTNFSTNLSLTLAKQGKRVIVVDADLGLANLHVVFGFMPDKNLEHVLRGERTLREIIYPGPGGVQIVAGGSGIVDLANLTAEQRDAFVDGLQELDKLADVIIIDTGAGLSHSVLAFLNAAEEIIVVTTPEPTSLTDAYATIKVVSGSNPQAKQRIMVNMANNEEEAEQVAHKLQLISQRFLGFEPEYLGYVPLDPAVPKAVRAQTPFTISNPNCEASKAVERIAEKLGYCEESSRPTGFTGFMNRMTQFFGFSGGATR